MCLSGGSSTLIKNQKLYNTVYEYINEFTNIVLSYSQPRSLDHFGNEKRLNKLNKADALKVSLKIINNSHGYCRAYWTQLCGQEICASS